jgi:8-oxo-dGTP pyrophosphatase MutT (NUDIX family)
MKKGKDRRRAEPDREPKTQYAALPWRRRADGTLEVLLITSRETRRWVIPKGWPIKNLSSQRSAAQEAFEEAGVVGVARRRAAGLYHYDKKLRSGRSQHVRVFVFPLEVSEERDEWPEKGQRDKLWTTPNEASALVEEPELRRVLKGFTP